MKGRFAVPREALISIGSASAAIMLSLALVLGVSMPNSNVVAALFPPWWDDATIFKAAAAAGDPVGTGLFSWVMIIRSDRPKLASRLRAEGALLLMDSRLFAGCNAQSSL